MSFCISHTDLTLIPSVTGKFFRERRANPDVLYYCSLCSGKGLRVTTYTLSVAYTNTVLTALYPKEMTTAMRTRLSNSLLVGDIIGMLAFGLASDRIGRRWGIIGCTILLVGGVTIATAAHGNSVNGMLWMMVVSR